MPRCTTLAMAHHFEETSATVAPGAYAVLLFDQASWHTTRKLLVPDNITLLLLPVRSPELNSVENLWQFLRNNWLENRIFQSYTDILDQCCDAWNKLIAQPWRIMSTGLSRWAHRF
jgi:transposase